jgi:hypothetical protein
MIVNKKLIEPVKKDWTVLHIPEKTCIIHRHGQSIRILYKKNGIEDISLIRRKLQIAINFLQPNKIIWQILPESPCLIELKCPKQEKSNRVVLISAASSVELRSISGISIQETMVIADGTHKLWKIKEWEKEAHELNLRFLSTSLTGSVTIDCQ